MTKIGRSTIRRWNRREAVRLLGVGALTLPLACRGSGPEPTDDTTASPASGSTGDGRQSAFADGAIVRTILEDVSPEQLRHGAVLFHEHMSLNAEFWETLLGEVSDEARARFFGPSDSAYFMQDVDAMVAEMQAASNAGVSAIVDGGHDDMGRDLGFLREVAERSGMPIIASGGYYTDPFIPAELATQTEDDIGEALAASAIEERWGAFGEIASSAEMTPAERKVLRAVAKAHVATNVPIFTHTANGLEAETQLDILESLGVPASHVVIGHLGGVDDPAATLHQAIAARGAFVGFDRLGGGPEADERKVPMIQTMLDAGYVDNVLLASDFAAATDTIAQGGPGYGKTITEFVPMLRAAGVSADEIRAMTVDNPLRFLAFVP